MRFLKYCGLIFLLAVYTACAFHRDADTKRIENAIYAYAEQEYPDSEYSKIFIEKIDTINLKGYINIMLNLLQEEKDILYSHLDDAEFSDDFQTQKILLEHIDILTERTAYWQDLFQTKDLSDKSPLFYLVYARLMNATTQEEVVIPIALDFQIKTIALTDSLP
jgi:hypothetical protein